MVDQLEGIISYELLVFTEPCFGMFEDRGQGEADEEVRGIPTGTFSQAEGFLLGGVGSFASGSEIHQVVERLGVPWDGRIESEIFGGVDIDDGSGWGVGLTEGTLWALVWIGTPGVDTLLVGGSFDWAVEEDTVAFGIAAVSSHGEPSGTERDALIVDLLGGSGGGGMDAVSGVEGDDGGDAGVGEVFIDAFGIVEGVVAGRVDLPVQAVFFEGFVESVEAFEGEGAVGFGGLAEDDVEGEIMALCGDDVLVEGMPEVIALMVGVISPVGGGVGVDPIVVASVDALLPAGAGGFSVGVGAGGEGRAIPADAQVGDVA